MLGGVRKAFLLALALGCGGERRPRPRPDDAPVAPPPSLSAILSIPSLDEGLRPLADLAQDLLPAPPARGGRELVVDLSGIGPDAEARLDGSRPAFVLLFGPEDPIVWALPLRGRAPVEAPPRGFARVVGETALVCESGALLDASEAFVARTLARERPDALSLRILGGPARARRTLQVEALLSGFARDLEASARQARAETAAPPTIGDPEAVGPLVEDLAREALGTIPPEGEIVVVASADGSSVRVEVRAPASSAVPSGEAPGLPSLEGALLGWSTVSDETARLQGARRVIAAFERIAGARLGAAERTALAEAAERFARARGDGAAWTLAPGAVAANFSASADQKADALAAARSLALLAERGHVRRVLSTLGLHPVTVVEQPGGVGIRMGPVAAGREVASEWLLGTTLSADLHLLRAVAALGMFGGERATALASLAGGAPNVPPAHLSVRRDDGHWQASLVVPRASARELGRVLRRALSN